VVKKAGWGGVAFEIVAMRMSAIVHSFGLALRERV